VQAPSPRVPQLDGLRGIAVSLVVLFHYGDVLVHVPVVGQIVSHGWIGVDMFFVMSGYLIGGIALDNREASNFLSVFYRRRFLRIFPLYYFVLLFVFVLHWIRPASDQYPAWIYIVYLQNYVAAFTGNPGTIWLQPTWSLAIEEQFYLVLPATLILLPRKYLVAILIAGILGAFALRLVGYNLPVQDPDAFSLFLTQTRGDGLLYGVLLAILLRNDPAAVGRWRTSFCIVPLAALIVFTLAAHLGELLFFTVGMAVVGPAFFCIVGLAVTRSNGLVASITDIWVIRWIGVRTYAIYLFHMPVLLTSRLVFQACHVESESGIRIVALVVTVGLAAASWVVLERPLILKGHAFVYRVKTVIQAKVMVV